MPQEYFIQDYIDYAAEFTDAPEIFHKFCAYIAVAAAISNHIYFEFGDLKIYPNLWIILMAPSSLFRKSTAIGICKRLLRSHDPDPILPNEFSHEALVEILSAKPQGLFTFSEFMSLATALEKDYMVGTKAFLTELYDSPAHYHRKTKGSEFEIIEPCVSILAATTLEWFLDKMKEKDLYGGFLTRFIFVPCKNKDKVISLPPPANREKRAALSFSLSQIANIKGKVVFSKEAIDLHDKWYEKNCIDDAGKYNGFIGSFINRLQVYLLKISIIEQVSLGYPGTMVHISKEAMEQALKSVDFLKRGLNILSAEEMTFDKYQEHRKKVVKIIEAQNGISRSELLSATRMPKKELDNIVESLIEEEKITEQTEDAETPGRKKRRYRIKV